jgi:HlyD family secretion protein
MTRRRAAATIIGLIAALGAAALTACQPGFSSDKHEAAAAANSPYATIANGKVDVEGGVVEVAARRAGVVREVVVREGDAVRKGEVLARLEDEDSILAVHTARAAVDEARSQLALTEVNLRIARRESERLERIAPSKVVPQQQLDQASDAVTRAQAQLVTDRAALESARAKLAQAQYGEELTIIRAPMDGRIIRRYANPGAGASTLNVSDMFDLEPAAPHIVRAEIVESAIPAVHAGQEAEITSEADPGTELAVGHVIRVAPTFGARKLKSDSANEATDERVVEVVVSADHTPYLIGQRVLVKFMKPGHPAGARRVAAAHPSE